MLRLHTLPKFTERLHGEETKIKRDVVLQQTNMFQTNMNASLPHFSISTKSQPFVYYQPWLEQPIPPRAPFYYVLSGIWKSALSKRRGLLAGEGSLLALCKSLNSPVPIFIGIPIMMHSDTPERGRREMMMMLVMPN